MTRAYWIVRNQKREGPYTAAVLVEKLSAGEVTQKDFVFYPGCKGLERIAEVEELQRAPAQPPAPARSEPVAVQGRTAPQPGPLQRSPGKANSSQPAHAAEDHLEAGRNGSVHQELNASPPPKARLPSKPPADAPILVKDSTRILSRRELKTEADRVKRLASLYQSHDDGDAVPLRRQQPAVEPGPISVPPNEEPKLPPAPDSVPPAEPKRSSRVLSRVGENPREKTELIPNQAISAAQKRQTDRPHPFQKKRAPMDDPLRHSEPRQEDQFPIPPSSKLTPKNRGGSRDLYGMQTQIVPDTVPHPPKPDPEINPLQSAVDPFANLGESNHVQQDGKGLYSDGQYEGVIRLRETAPVEAEAGDSPSEDGILLVEALYRKRDEALEEARRHQQQVPEPDFVNSLGIGFRQMRQMNCSFAIWPVRLRDFRAFADASGYDAGPKWREPDFLQTDTCPVTFVSWLDATAFCQWLTEYEQSVGQILPSQVYRLPADLEWSVAVGISYESGQTPAERHLADDEDYPWGGIWPPPEGAGNYCDLSASRKFGWDPVSDSYDDGYIYTSPVGQFTPTREGLYDMSGNVWEWVYDWFDAEQGKRTLRGGSWTSSDPEELLSSARLADLPENRRGKNGFRIVLTNG